MAFSWDLVAFTAISHFENLKRWETCCKHLTIQAQPADELQPYVVSIFFCFFVFEARRVTTVATAIKISIDLDFCLNLPSASSASSHILSFIQNVTVTAKTMLNKKTASVSSKEVIMKTEY